jgi:hypothetical protein
MSRIDDALVSALVPLQKSLENKDDELWEKWFGSGDSKSDDDVTSRMEDATNFMSQRGEAWKPLCCTNSLGACGGCASGVMAYVTSWNYLNDDETSYNGTFVRLCNDLLNEPDLVQFGLVLYHELIHMVSHVGDAEGAYGKLGAH